VKRLRGEQGITLLELMVALGVGGIVTYLVVTLLMNMGKQTASVNSKSDLNLFANEVQGVLGNSERCRAAFQAVPSLKDLGAVGDPKTKPVQITMITGNTDPSKGAVAPAWAAGSALGANLVITKLELLGKTEVKDNANSAADTHWSIPLHLVANRHLGGKTAPQTAVGGDVLQKTFNLNVSLDADGKITGCFGQHKQPWGPSKRDPMNHPLDIVYYGGGVGIDKDPDPGVKMDVDGSARALTYAYRSDARLKENIREVPGALERLRSLHGVVFQWKDRTDPANDGDQLGFIAQEVEPLFPEAVVTDGAGFKSVDYESLLAPLVEALKERQKLLVKQEHELAELRQALRKR
jgi:type II secretory pathway pseudopilin PulG